MLGHVALWTRENIEGSAMSQTEANWKAIREKVKQFLLSKLTVSLI